MKMGSGGHGGEKNNDGRVKGDFFAGIFLGFLCVDAWVA